LAPHVTLSLPEEPTRKCDRKQNPIARVSRRFIEFHSILVIEFNQVPQAIGVSIENDPLVILDA